VQDPRATSQPFNNGIATRENPPSIRVGEPFNNGIATREYPPSIRVGV
jgi:hypothetical protein